MASDVRILGWTAEGLRCPDHEFNFIDQQVVHSISLVQMPNGTGKTTVLELLRAALSGDAGNGKWGIPKVMSMAKKGTKPEAGRFTVKLLANGRRLTIEMKFNFEEGTIEYTTTGNVGITNGFEPPREIAKFLKPEFVKFFIFDGELAERLLSPTDTNAETAIENLFQLKILTDLSLRVQTYWQEIASSKGAKETKGLSRRANKVEFLANRLKKLTEFEKQARERLSLVLTELREKENKFQAELAQQAWLNKQIEEANNILDRAKRDMDNTSVAVLLKMRNPHTLSMIWAQGLHDLKQSLDKAKLPESAAREFFEELANEAECVCGRPLDENSRAAIRNRAQQYLGSEDVALLNSIKADISSLIGDNPNSHETELNDLLSNLERLISEYENNLTHRDGLIQDAMNADPSLKEVENEINRLKEQIDQLESDVDKYKDTSEALGDENTFGLDVLKRRLKNAAHQLAEITDTIELKTKTTILADIIANAHRYARDTVSKKIVDEANARISDLMPYNLIRIDRIDRCLKLVGQEGGSVGEQLAIAYAFLSTLFNSSDHSLPFVVDSPANPIDLHVRRKVAELIPKLTNQFIAFTISSERQGFLEPLESSAMEPIQYLTLFRKGNHVLEDRARQFPKYMESQDGLVVSDRQFFCEFQLDSENGSVGNGIQNQE